MAPSHHKSYAIVALATLFGSDALPRWTARGNTLPTQREDSSPKYYQWGRFFNEHDVNRRIHEFHPTREAKIIHRDAVDATLALLNG